MQMKTTPAHHWSQTKVVLMTSGPNPKRLFWERAVDRRGRLHNDPLSGPPVYFTPEHFRVHRKFPNRVYLVLQISFRADLTGVQWDGGKIGDMRREVKSLGKFQRIENSYIKLIVVNLWVSWSCCKESMKPDFVYRLKKVLYTYVPIYIKFI